MVVIRRGRSHPHESANTIAPLVETKQLAISKVRDATAAPADVLTETKRGVGGYPDAWALIIQHAAVNRTSVPCTKGSKAGRTASMTWARVRSSSP